MGPAAMYLREALKNVVPFYCAHSNLLSLLCNKFIFNLKSPTSTFTLGIVMLLQKLGACVCIGGGE